MASNGLSRSVKERREAHPCMSDHPIHSSHLKCRQVRQFFHV
jgi:hypothetical protein